jgi:FKBP-type peptidyl-prolyl cis-trans isomerase SlpA
LNTVRDGSFLTLHYRLAGPDGADVVSTFNDQPATLSVGAGQLSPAIEQKLIGLEEGSEATFALAPGEAFGPRNPEMIQRVSRSLLAEHADPEAEYHLGDVVEFPTPDGSGRFAGVVAEADSGDVGRSGGSCLVTQGMADIPGRSAASGHDHSFERPCRIRVGARVA